MDPSGDHTAPRAALISHSTWRLLPSASIRLRLAAATNPIVRASRDWTHSLGWPFRIARNARVWPFGESATPPRLGAPANSVSGGGASESRYTGVSLACGRNHHRPEEHTSELQSPYV